MTQDETNAALSKILRQMMTIACQLQAHADDLTGSQMAVVRERHLKSEPQTIGNVVALPGVSLEAARRAQQRWRRKETR